MMQNNTEQTLIPPGALVPMEDWKKRESVSGRGRLVAQLYIYIYSSLNFFNVLSGRLVIGTFVQRMKVSKWPFPCI